MNRSERYATVLVFVCLFATVSVFASLAFMANYHMVSQIGMTVSVANGGYLAREGVIDEYPYMPTKSQFFGIQQQSSNATEIIQWAITNAYPMVYDPNNTRTSVHITAGYYHINGPLTLDGVSNRYLHGDYITKQSEYIQNFTYTSPLTILVYSSNNAIVVKENVTNIAISNFGFLTEEQFSQGVSIS
jgi:hypothetical protein